MGYITNCHDDVANVLAKLPFTFKGQWVIQIEPNKFIGLDNLGTLCMNLENWVIHLRTKLLVFSKESEQFDIFSMIGLPNDEYSLIISKRLINLYFKDNKMNKWGFYTKLGFASIKAKWTSEGIVTLKYNNSHNLLQ